MLDRPDILDWAAAFGPILKEAFPAETAAKRMAVSEALGMAVMDRRSWFSSALTPSAPKDGFDRDWCISMAKQEAGYAIGAGELAIDPFTPSALSGDASKHVETLNWLSSQYLPGGPRDVKGAIRAAVNALAPKVLCEHGHADPMALCSDCEANSSALSGDAGEVERLRDRLADNARTFVNIARALAEDDAELHAQTIAVCSLSAEECAAALPSHQGAE